MLKVKLEANVRIGRDALYPLPPELLALLRSIRQHGSLVRAIGDVRISYRHAWALIGRWSSFRRQHDFPASTAPRAAGAIRSHPVAGPARASERG